MSYAIRKDGKGFRSVNSPSDVGPDEAYATEQPGPIAPSPQELRATELNALFATYQADMQALQSAWVSALIKDGASEANRKAVISEEIAEVAAQYAEDVAAVKQKYLPQEG